MSNIAQCLASISAYPVPQTVIINICEGRGLDADAQRGYDIAKSAEYNLAKADVLRWLASAPNVSQGGQTYSLSEYERKQMLAQADNLMQEYGGTKPRYGYKGTRL